MSSVYLADTDTTIYISYGLYIFILLLKYGRREEADVQCVIPILICQHARCSITSAILTTEQLKVHVHGCGFFDIPCAMHT